MTEKRHHYQQHDHRHHRRHRKVFRNWKLFVVVALMLIGMAVYIFSMDEGWQPSSPGPEQPVPESEGSGL